MTTRKKKIQQTEDKRVHDYELVVIISPEVVDEALETKIDDISKLITGKEGVISTVEQWGKRKLSYPIKHFAEGNYVLAKFKMDPKWSKELEATLLISEEILRHLLVRLNS
ncbi:30S ribosomal protein S6 [Chloroflexota bacterium]